MRKEIKWKRKRSLYMVFIRYLLRFCVLTVILAAGTLIVYTVLVNTGILRLPTYEQSRIEEAADKIQQEGDEATLIPDSCRFGVYNPDGNFLYGTFEGNERQEGWERWKNGDTGAFYNIFYRSIKKDDGNLVIVRYEMIAKFSNPILRKIFPNAEFLILFIALLLFLTQMALTARNFGIYLKKRLDILTEIAAKVGQEDLDFEREYSDIREVDDVLGALFKMKEALGRTKNLAVECSFPGEEFMIRGRKGFREELLRAMGNVLSNGVDYSPAEQTLRIRAELRARAELRVRAGQKEISGLETFSEEKQDGGTFLQITVADSGPGFSGEALRHGTDHFYQADKSRVGTVHYGLGLYIARTVLEENSGALEIGNTEETGGGEVRIYVPCSVVSGETEDDQS